MDLPDKLGLLRINVTKIKEDRGLTWEQVPTLAIQFCLSHPAVSTVLIGALTISELEQTFHTAKFGSLDNEELRALEGYALEDERLTNPSFWSLL